MPSTRSLTALPKVHVHAHLDGSYPRDAVLALARRRGVDLDPDRDLPERTGAPGGPGGWRDVWEFFEAYGRVPALVADLDDLAELCGALVAQEAAQGVVYLEPAVEPQLYAPRLGSLRDVTRVVLEAFADAATRHGVEVGALLTVNTDQDEPIAGDLTDVAVEFAGAGVTAFGTAGFEEPSGLQRFAAHAARARAAGCPSWPTPGRRAAGSASRRRWTSWAPPGSPTGCGRWRTRSSCAGSSRRASSWTWPPSPTSPSGRPDLAAHPAPVLHRAGVGVTLNADDQLWFGRSVTDQYAVARDVWGSPTPTSRRSPATGCAWRG